MHALVIEDQYLIAMLIEDELRDLGYTSFDFVTREREAVEAAARRCPDLITADNKLTDGTGVIAVQEICEKQVIPVVFIVAAPKSIQAPVPFAAVVAKPFEARALRSAIGDALVLAREHRAAGMIG
ncbi:MAG TPA: response regulator [Allosphingosinicella sp.]|jgi:CheY-like chemotaxis protein